MRPFFSLLLLRCWQTVKQKRQSEQIKDEKLEFNVNQNVIVAGERPNTRSASLIVSQLGIFFGCCCWFVWSYCVRKWHLSFCRADANENGLDTSFCIKSFYTKFISHHHQHQQQRRRFYSFFCFSSASRRSEWFSLKWLRQVTSWQMYYLKIGIDQPDEEKKRVRNLSQWL